MTPRHSRLSYACSPKLVCRSCLGYTISPKRACNNWCTTQSSSPGWRFHTNTPSLIMASLRRAILA